MTSTTCPHHHQHVDTIDGTNNKCTCQPSVKTWLMIEGGFTEEDVTGHLERLRQGGCDTLDAFQCLTEQDLKGPKYGFTKNFVVRSMLKAVEECKQAQAKIAAESSSQDANPSKQPQKSIHAAFSTVKDPPPCEILASHDDGVNAVVFSYDGNNKYLYSASDDFTIGVWEVSSAQLVKKLRQHFSMVTCIAASPTSDMFCSGDKRGAIIFWNGDQQDATAKNDFTPRKTTMKHKSSVTSIAFSHDGKLVYSVNSLYNQGFIWNAETGDMLNEVHGGLCVIALPVESCPTNFFLVVDAVCCTIISRAPRTGVITSSELPYRENTAAAIMRDNEHIAIAGGSGSIRLVRMTKLASNPPHVMSASDFTFTTVKSARGHSGKAIYCVAASWKLIATGGADSTIHIWSAFESPELQCLNILTSKYSAPIYGLSFTGDGQMLASGSTDSAVKFFLA